MAVPHSRVIRAPSAGVLDMLLHRMPQGVRNKLDGVHFGAVGLIQTNVANMLYFADVAQKEAAVTAVALNGSCPQHIVTLALAGDVSAVEAAMKAIESACEKPAR